MGAESKIEWTDATWNPVRGCTKVSAGCRNCYAETFAERWRGIPGHPFEQGFDLRLVPEKLEEPLRWKRPRRIFVNSMSDLFHKKVPESYLLKVIDVMRRAHWHTFQVLTKRADRMYELFAGYRFDVMSGESWFGKPDGRPDFALLKNVQLGVSVEDQPAAERIPLLLKTPAAVRFLSCEPLLGPLRLEAYLGAYPEDEDGAPYPGRIGWVIAGGESGPRARPMHPDWARSLRDQCQATGTPFFFKQWGEWEPEGPHFGGMRGSAREVFVTRQGRTGHVWGESEDVKSARPHWMRKVGKGAAGRLLDGREWNEVPEVV